MKTYKAIYKVTTTFEVEIKANDESEARYNASLPHSDIVERFQDEMIMIEPDCFDIELEDIEETDEENEY